MLTESDREAVHFGTCVKCGTSGQFVPDGKGGARIRIVNTRVTGNHWDTLMRLVVDSKPHGSAPFHALVKISERENRDLQEIADFIRDEVFGESSLPHPPAAASDEQGLSRAICSCPKPRLQRDGFRWCEICGRYIPQRENGR